MTRSDVAAEAAGLVFTIAMFGCGSHGVGDAAKAKTDTPISECDAYVTAVRGCMAAAGPAACSGRKRAYGA
jgi:hypothetical protein